MYSEYFNKIAVCINWCRGRGSLYLKKYILIEWSLPSRCGHFYFDRGFYVVMPAATYLSWECVRVLFSFFRPKIRIAERYQGPGSYGFKAYRSRRYVPCIHTALEISFRMWCSKYIRFPEAESDCLSGVSNFPNAN